MDLQALEQQINDRKQQEDYEQKRSNAFGKICFLGIRANIDTVKEIIMQMACIASERRSR